MQVQLAQQRTLLMNRMSHISLYLIYHDNGEKTRINNSIKYSPLTPYSSHRVVVIHAGSLHNLRVL